MPDSVLILVVDANGIFIERILSFPGQRDLFTRIRNRIVILKTDDVCLKCATPSIGASILFSCGNGVIRCTPFMLFDAAIILLERRRHAVKGHIGLPVWSAVKRQEGTAYREVERSQLAGDVSVGRR